MPNWLALGFRFDDDGWFDIRSVSFWVTARFWISGGAFSRVRFFISGPGDRECRVESRRFVHMGRVHPGGP